LMPPLAMTADELREEITNHYNVGNIDGLTQKQLAKILDQ